MPAMYVKRSITINASPEQVYGWVNDFSTWTKWSPWLCSEPDAEVTVSEHSKGVGALYAWHGKVVGSGEIEHLAMSPYSSIQDELRFKTPFPSTSKVGFQFDPVADGTRVTWTMDGALPWFLFWMKSQIEGFVGMDYDRGLMMLKEIIEHGSITSKLDIQGKTQVGPLYMLGVRKTCDVKDVGPNMDQALSEARSKLHSSNLPTSDCAISVYHKFDMRKMQFEYTSGYLQPSLPASVPAGLSAWSIPSTPAFEVDHTGSYQHLGNAWSAANALLRHHKLKAAKHHPFEIYRVAGSDRPESELLTEVYLPFK